MSATKIKIKKGNTLTAEKIKKQKQRCFKRVLVKKMNELEKIFAEKFTENGDKAYNSTGNNLIDLLFMADFFDKNLEQVHIGNSEKEQLFAMYMRDPRFGQGRRDLGRKLMKLSGCITDQVITAGRYDDLWHIGTDNMINYLHTALLEGNELAKKWMPRLTGKDKRVAKILCKMWGITEKEYRALIKTDKTVEYKLSYAEKDNNTPLNDVFEKGNYKHPLVETINFEQVPSLAMTKYLNTFSTREDIKDRFGEYIKAVKENKAKVNTSTANVHDAYKSVNNSNSEQSEEASDVIGKKIIEQETDNLSLNCICVLDTSGSMYFSGCGNNSNIGDKATSIAHSLATHSTYAPNQVISFSSRPQLMTIKGNTLKEQYQSMYTGDCSNTDLGAVFKILMGLNKFPEYVIVMSDMEFDEGSSFNQQEWMKLVKETGANTKMIWWNFNDRHRTSPEFDENGNIYMSGYDIQALLQLPGVIDMDEYINKLLDNYKKKIGL